MFCLVWLCIVVHCIMVRGRIKGYRQCYKSFVTQLTTQLCEAIKETQTRRRLLQRSIHPLAVFHT